MFMGSRLTFSAVIIVFIFLINAAILAQHVQVLSDRDWIALSIDLLRKGVQEEDTAKIVRALAPVITIVGEGVADRDSLTKRFKGIFDNSDQRDFRLDRPNYSRIDNPRQTSDSWDFDILEPQITINGDTAIVECVLVLWGAPPDGITQGPGRRVNERLVFVAQNSARLVGNPVDGKRWSSKQATHHPLNSRKHWQLSGFEKVIQFLENESVKSSKSAEPSGAKK
ncbi:MAG: hypothetical protein IH931_06670 [candidate division Zixibacteria bacterium]|nr:hypothetical protein [candidate division Zixibacteria bacterium]